MIGITTKLKLAMLGSVSLITIGFIGYLYISNLQLEAIVREQEGTIEVHEMEIENLLAVRERLRANAKEQAKVLGRIMESQRKKDSSIKDLEKELRDRDSQLTTVTRKLESYKGRLKNASLKKPTLVQRLANRKLNSIMREYEQATDPDNYSRGENETNDGTTLRAEPTE